jgi:hypothetical protein
MSNKSRISVFCLSILAACVALVFSLSSIVSAATYRVCSTCTYTDLQAAIDVAIADNVISTIRITEDGVYDGPFIVRRHAESVSIIGSTTDREKIILTNEDSKLYTNAPHIPYPMVLTFGFNHEDFTQGTAVTVKHLTIAASELVSNGRMEGTYSGDGLALGWSKIGSIVPSEVTYASDYINVLTGLRAQKFTGSGSSADSIITSTDQLNPGQDYLFSLWVKRTSLAGTIYIELSGAATQTLSTSNEHFTKLTYRFNAASADLKIKIYADVAGTVGVVDDIAVNAYVRAGILIRGRPDAGTGNQEISDCVIRNMGWEINGLDDPELYPDEYQGDTGDDRHGHGIAVWDCGNPLIVDNDIRDNYDAVVINDATCGDKNVPADNPRLWSTGMTGAAEGWQQLQRLRLSARFGVGVRNGASPYIGDNVSADLYYANDVNANGWANIACQDDSEPRIYYNYIDGYYDWQVYYYVDSLARNPSKFGIISRDVSQPIIVGNWISAHNLNAVSAQEESQPKIGYQASFLARSNIKVNNIFDNNIFAFLDPSDPDYISCEYGEFDNEYCAAVASRNAAQPIIKNNDIDFNSWVGVGSKDWASPIIQGNWITWNRIGVAFMAVRTSSIVNAKIGGTGAGEGNVISDNELGVAMTNCGSPIARVKISGNEVSYNRIGDRGVGIVLNNAFVEIDHNEINYNGGGSGITRENKAGIGVSNNTNALIYSNHITNNMGPAIGCLDAEMEVKDNLIVDNYGGRYAPIIYVGSKSNYVQNSDLEPAEWEVSYPLDGVAPHWHKEGSIITSENTSIVSSGGSAQQLSGGDGVDNYVFQALSTGIKVEYTFSAWIRRLSGGTASIRLCDPVSNYIYTTLSTSSLSYTEVSATFTAVSKCLQIRLYRCP